MQSREGLYPPGQPRIMAAVRNCVREGEGSSRAGSSYSGVDIEATGVVHGGSA